MGDKLENNENVIEIEYKEKDFLELQDILNRYKEKCSELIEHNDLMFRITILENSIKKSIHIKNIDFEYLSRLHELKSIYFFSKLGSLNVSNDYKHEPGPDLLFNTINIECVTANVGSNSNYKKLKESGFEKYSPEIVDYTEKSRQMILRFTTALKAKVDQYRCVWKNEYQPFCIFLHLGRFTLQYNCGEYLEEMNRFLIGKGSLTLTYDSRLNKFVAAHYQQDEYIRNNNSADVVVNFFSDEKNKIVSAVIISSAYYTDDYDLDNTVVFTNYNAINMIDTECFKNFIIWTTNDVGEYIPTRNGEQLKLKDIKIF